MAGGDDDTDPGDIRSSHIHYFSIHSHRLSLLAAQGGRVKQVHRKSEHERIGLGECGGYLIRSTTGILDSHGTPVAQRPQPYMKMW